MPNSPPIIESQISDPQNPNPISDSENPFHNPVDSQHPLQNPPPEFPQEEKPQLSVEDQQEEEPQLTTEDQEQEDLEQEQEGMSVSLSPAQNPSMSNPAVSSVKRGNKRRKGFAKNYKSQLAIEKKLQTLLENFNPIPFVPVKALDFSKHEELLRKLGLWDFAHIDFDKNLRSDLIGQLVVNYAHNPKLRNCYVNDCRIGVNRADLGRALMLPGKKTAGDCEGEVYPAEFLSFLEEFVSNWMLLHGEDLWCTPTEIVNWMNLIRSGHPEKVDWAGLVWYMVEKELAQGQKLTNCYYASHLQQLIKSQKDDLLMENSRVEVSVDDDDDCSEVKRFDYESCFGGQKSEGQNVEVRTGQDCVTRVENVDDADNKAEKAGDCGEMDKDGDVGRAEKVGGGDEVEKDGDVDMVENVDDKMEAVDDGVHNVGNVDENNMVESVERAGHGGSVEIADEHVEDVDNTDERGENVDTADEHVENVDDSANAKDNSKDVDMLDFGYQGQWLLDGRNDGGQHFMQRCSMAGVKVSAEHDKEHDGGGEDIENEDVEEVGNVEGFKIMPKNPLDGMPSANLMQAFGTGQMPFGSSELGGQSSLELMSSRPENNVMMGGPSMFNHAGKREMVHDHDISHSGLNDNHKKMRIDGSWDPKSHGLHMIFEQMNQLTEKAKIYHETVKEEIYQEASMTQQILNHQILEKENEFMQLRCKFDDQQRRMHMEIQRRDRELYLMNSVIDGYRRALKETQRAFAEYRKRCAVVDEPIYKDAGDGGVVKSIMELEKERIKQEEEKKIMCILLEETYRKHLRDYELKWEELLDNVQSLDSRLLNAGKEVETLKEKLVKPKTADSAQNADIARNADSDQNGDSAQSADSARNADNAQNADSAQNEGCAQSADSAQNQNES